ncbi:MAG: DNA cytosine methyltransferase [Sulfuricella sp.]
MLHTFKPEPLLMTPACTYERLEPRENSQKTTPLSVLPMVVSLFSGAGGLDWGFRYHGFKVPLAIDISPAAIKTHKRNFRNTHGIVADLIKLGPIGVLEKVKERIPEGTRIGVIGGPPCQGFSRANTRSQAADPRNKLPALYLDIIETLKQHYAVEFVVFENVLGIRDKKHVETYKALMDGLSALSFIVTEKELCALDFGVPQNRRRIVLSAMRDGQGYSRVRPKKRKGLDTVREAIGGLPEPAFFERTLDPSNIPVHPNHWTMKPKSPRFDNPESAPSNSRSFKRLIWEAPSPTIAFGHREIHIHPNGRRRLSIYEAMLLQGFPETFVLEGNLSEQVEQVSNAVPPPLARSIAAAVKLALAGTNHG